MGRAACGGCGVLISTSRGSRGNPVCHECRRAQWSVCDRCGGQCEPRRKAGKRFCDGCKRQRWRCTRADHGRPADGRLAVGTCVDCRWESQHRKDIRRRAFLKSCRREPYTLSGIARRDGHRCRICGGGVRMARLWPDPWSPSIDHIRALSRGGDDTPANVRLAHLRCNVRRGAA